MFSSVLGFKFIEMGGGGERDRKRERETHSKIAIWDTEELVLSLHCTWISFIPDECLQQ